MIAQVLSQWDFEPSIVLGTALLIAAYLAAYGPLRSYFAPDEPDSPRKIAWFLLGVAVIFCALVSPLDALSDHYLFTAHMLQHALLMVIAPPLLLMGTPGWMLRPALKYRLVMRLARIVTMPLVAFVLFNAGLLLWHLPVLYEAALENESIHALEHVTFIVTGVINWMPLLSPLPELPRLSYVGQIIYLLLNGVPSALLGWYFTVVPTVVYPTYAAAPQLFALYSTNDQFIGGVMMAMPMGLLFLAALRAQPAADAAAYSLSGLPLGKQAVK